MNENEQKTGTRFSVEEMEEVLGVKGIRPEHVVAVNRLAEAWELQASIGGLNQENVSYISHAADVRATALMPSMKLMETDQAQFEVLSGLSQLARAEAKLIEWAYQNKFTVDSTAGDVPKQMDAGK